MSTPNYINIIETHDISTKNIQGRRNSEIILLWSKEDENCRATSAHLRVCVPHLWISQCHRGHPKIVLTNTTTYLKYSLFLIWQSTHPVTEALWKLYSTQASRDSPSHDPIQQEEQFHDQYYHHNNGVLRITVNSGNITKGAHHIQYIKEGETSWEKTRLT